MEKSIKLIELSFNISPLTQNAYKYREVDLSLTLSRPNKLLSAKFLVRFNFQSASMSLKIRKYVAWVSNSLDPDKMLSYSASHPDPSCLNVALLVLLGGLRIKA